MRRENDAYYTPAWQVRALLAHQPIAGTVIEPCVGDGAIANILKDHALVFTNDIDRNCEATWHMDASQPEFWAQLPPFDWAVTNPPYEMPMCRDIVALAFKHARVGIAMLLRLSFEEPTAKVHPRGPWLEAHPLARKFTLPRYSYTQNGKSDSTTTAWMLWAKVPLPGPPMLSLYKADERYAQPLPPAQIGGRSLWEESDREESA